MYQRPVVEPSIMDSFGSAAVDIEQLEKEIALKEESRRERAELSGNIAGMAGPPPPRRTNMQEVDLHAELDTLDEPVWDTVKRDLNTVGMKFLQVVLPRTDRKQLLKDWDLWGPLFICVALSLVLQGHSADVKAPQFTQVFTITFFGACIVTMNIKLLGGNISFFQSLCVIGYCLLPPTISAFLCRFFLPYFILRLAITGVAFGWATYSAMGFLAGSQPEKRRMLIVYPIFLFYFVVSWLIILHTSW